MSPSPPITERRLLFLVGAVQAVNILDFMMVMPLGPDFAQALGIPTAHIGWIGGSYTVAAAFSGILGRSSSIDSTDAPPSWSRWSAWASRPRWGASRPT